MTSTIANAIRGTMPVDLQRLLVCCGDVPGAHSTLMSLLLLHGRSGGILAATVCFPIDVVYNWGPAPVIDSKLPMKDAEDSSPRVLTEESFNDVIRRSLSSQLREERERRRIAEDSNKSLASCVQNRERDKDGNSNAWTKVSPKRKFACHEPTPDHAKTTRRDIAGMPEQVGKQTQIYSTIGKRPRISTAEAAQEVVMRSSSAPCGHGSGGAARGVSPVRRVKRPCVEDDGQCVNEDCMSVELDALRAVGEKMRKNVSECALNCVSEYECLMMKLIGKNERLRGRIEECERRVEKYVCADVRPSFAAVVEKSVSAASGDVIVPVAQGRREEHCSFGGDVSWGVTSPRIPVGPTQAEACKSLIREVACVKCAQNHLSTNCSLVCEIDLKRSENNLETNTHYAYNTSDKNTNLKDSRNYAQVTANTTLQIDQKQTINKYGNTEINELLKQSIKNTELIAKMLIEQNALPRQQTQQLTTMLKFNQEHIQATAFTVQTDCNAFQVSAIYAPPRHKMGTCLRTASTVKLKRTSSKGRELVFKTDWPTTSVSQIGRKSNNLTIIETVNWRSLLLTLDTGATHSNLRPDLAGETVEPLSGYRLFTATGEEAKILGSVICSVFIGTLIVVHTFLVAEIMDETIIGVDFMSTMDLNRRVLSCQKMEIPLYIGQGECGLGVRPHHQTYGGVAGGCTSLLAANPGIPGALPVVSSLVWVRVALPRSTPFPPYSWDQIWNVI
ncbi:hypothetical protein WN48_09692 [Eufriesea mexicana]|uniref:Peptidase A2 domain-containing protein n=1 Tax=Eufriesea mexicana TaxID=516756 RepID=A0A310SIW3_9HYME|nr:hypothetical protein WN48_09692 [Eufriesea mexicana]